MAEVRYKDESAHALRLRLYAGSVPHDGLTLLQRGRAARRGVFIDAAVIGSSHLMQVRMGDLILTEMLACQTAPAGEPLAWWRPGAPAVEHRFPGGQRYRFEARLLGWEEARQEKESIRRTVYSATHVPGEVGLSFQFPAEHRDAPSAETLVWAAVSKEGVAARTVHSYPSEGLVVLSATHLESTRAASSRTGRMALAHA